MEVIERNCKAQARLIDEMMDISRVVSGKLDLTVRPCELSAVIAEAIEIVLPMAKEKALGFDTDLNPAASLAFCDPVRIRQVVWNLLVNAVKFTPNGGKIRVTLTRERQDPTSKSATPAKGLLPIFFHTSSTDSAKGS